MLWLKWGLNKFVIIWDYFLKILRICLHRSLSTLSQSHKFRSRCPTLTRSRSPTKNEDTVPHPCWLLTGMCEMWESDVVCGRWRPSWVSWRASCRGNVVVPVSSSWTIPHTPSSTRHSWPAPYSLQVTAAPWRHYTPMMMMMMTMMTSLHFRSTSSNNAQSRLQVETDKNLKAIYW